jgi:hypothetical protein
MRKLVILAGIGILCLAAWTVTLDAQNQGRGSMSGSPAYGSLVVYPRYIQYHTENIGGLIFPVELQISPSLFPGQADLGHGDQDTSAGGAPVSGPGSMAGDHQGVGDHHGGPASHPYPHALAHGEHGTALNPQPTATHAADSDQAGAAAGQPNPAPSAFSPRPPGAAGPGRRVSGRYGPGLPGPGRRASPRW